MGINEARHEKDHENHNNDKKHTKHKGIYILLYIFISISAIIKLILIFTQGNNLALFSDDLNYVKSAVALVKKGIFVFHEYNEPTVFITPVYPLFLAGIFKVFGYGFTGFQAARVIQAVLSSVTIILVFLTAKCLFGEKSALVSAFLVSFYFPNIVTAGYFLTETLFSTLLALLVYLSLKFSSAEPLKEINFGLLGIIWAIAALCRPTIALYPAVLFLWLLASKKISFKKTENIKKAVKLVASMAISFIIVMSPWWLRNYREYNEFIPLAASSGNPMLQGTYINYLQTPENIVYYKLGENAFETNKTEVEVAKKRMRDGFRQNFLEYLKWYTVGKTKLFWGTVFYWREFMGIRTYMVIPMHYLILLGFAGIPMAARMEILKRRSRRSARAGQETVARHMLIPGILLYFNAVHCYYMAFDRYAFPLLPLLCVYTGFFICEVFKIARRVTQGRG
ncbi:MAG: glycosyltransferase family 39 protein [Clostridiaceae bacterium]|nr:glycosyltransferase family 39 protein [Clostridiaceae bacterium]